MSTRAERRRHQRAAAKARPILPEGDYGTTAGWCATQNDLPEARRQVHDVLISLMGAQRVGGVQWRWWTGAEAEQALGVLRVGTVGEHADNYRRIGAHLREYGGFLVVAMAEGSPQMGRCTYDVFDGHAPVEGMVLVYLPSARELGVPVPDFVVCR